MQFYLSSHLVPFFFNDTATTEIYTLSLTTLFRSRLRNQFADGDVEVSNDAEPKRNRRRRCNVSIDLRIRNRVRQQIDPAKHEDRKSTRLNSSHPSISYAVFCLKKKIKNNKISVKQ